VFEIASGYSVFVTQFSRCTENIQANDRIHSTSHDHIQSEYRKCIFQMQICGKTPNSGGKVHTRSCRMRYSNLLITWPTLATWVHRHTYFAFVHTRLEMYCTLEGKHLLQHVNENNHSNLWSRSSFILYLCILVGWAHKATLVPRKHFWSILLPHLISNRLWFVRQSSLAITDRDIY
jgi:hypothetical protein